MKLVIFFRKVYRKLLVFLTWIKYHNKFELGRNVVICNLKIHGCYNKHSIKIGTGSYLEDCTFSFNTFNDNILEIGGNCKLISSVFIMRNGGGNSIKIGSKCSCGGNVQFAACEGKSIVVGEDCQFAHHIDLWTTDHHPIYDKQGKRINNGKNIFIGNHVWIGSGALILKGVSVVNGCIIGAHSVVTSECAINNSIYAGVPAKLVKSDILWRRNFEGSNEA